MRARLLKTTTKTPLELALGYIRDGDLFNLKQILTTCEDLKFQVCPNSGHNLLGFAIINQASLGIIRTLIQVGVPVDGDDDFKVPLKMIRFIAVQPEHLLIAHELILAGASFDFYSYGKVLWLNNCQECSPKLYDKVIIAIKERAELFGEFKEPMVSLINFNTKIQQDLLEAKRMALIRKIGIEQEEEFVQLKQVILTAKNIAEQALKQATCSIQMQINNNNVPELSIKKTRIVKLPRKSP